MVGGSSEMESCRDANANDISCDESINGRVDIGDPVKDSGELDVDLLHAFDSYVEDISDGLIISRMVNDSIIRGMVNAVEQEAADKIAQKELELARLNEMLKSYHVGPDENQLLSPSLKNNEPKIEQLGGFSRLSDVLVEHDKILESFGRLKIAAEGQLKNLRKDIHQIRGHGPIRKINSVSGLVGLGGILQENEPKKWIDVEKTLDSLRITLESVYEQVGNIVYTSKVSLSQWQQEQEYLEEVEHMVVTTCIQGLQEQLEERLQEQESLSNPESGTLNSQSSLEINGNISNNEKTDHLQQKVPGDHVSSSISLWEGNGKHGELVITVPESLDGTHLIHMTKEELIFFFKVEMTKMKRNHDYKLQEMTEKYFSLKRKYLKEKGSSLPFRKDKEFDVLKKKIPDVIVKLDRILVENEKVPLLGNNNDNLVILKDRCESLLSENRQLRDSLSDRKKEVNHLSSQLSDAMEKMSQYSFVNENLLERVENLESAIEGAHIQATINWDVYNCLIRGAISQIKWMSEDSEVKHSIMKGIYNLILKDDSCNMSQASESGFKESDLESLAVDGLCAIIYREAFTEAQEKLHDLSMNAFEKERVLKLEVAEKEKLQQHVLLMTSAINEKEKLHNETAAALGREMEKYIAASQELDTARDQKIQLQMIISKCSEESSVLKTNLQQASEELVQHKGEIRELNSKLDQAVKDLNKSNDERRKLLLAAKVKDDILSLVKANENEHRKQMKSIIILVRGLFKEFAAFECQVAEYMKRSNLRLENLSSQAGSLIQMVNMLKRKRLQYKQSLQRKCSDLETAEAEVDLLGDEVEGLLGLLEKIYIALDHYSPVLKHYPGIMDVLKLVRMTCPFASLPSDQELNLFSGFQAECIFVVVSSDRRKYGYGDARSLMGMSFFDILFLSTGLILKMDPQPSPSGRSSTVGRASSFSVADSGGQTLSSVLNNPHAGKLEASWGGWWSVAPPEFLPLTSTKATSDLARYDFQSYVSSVSDSYHRFEDIRNHTTKEQSLDVDNIGEALVACLREVPALYFKEDFALEDGGTFRAACPFNDVSENIMLQEKLTHYLDVVELHLVKEISLRSNSFFEAQGQLEDLNVKIVEGCNRIRDLKETIRLVDTDLVDSARQIQELNATRTNLLALQNKLKLILSVNQALSALKLLVASAECAGALDIIDDLQHLLDGDELTGLHCFRHLRDHVVASIDSINSILSAEFMRASIHDAGDKDAVILLKAKARVSISLNGDDVGQVKLDEEETNFRDRLLPLIIGLLRTAKLPFVLRNYRDTLTADMKTAIKTAVAELLPVLVGQPPESDMGTERTMDADGGGLSLASKLRSLSSGSFVQLLAAIFKIVQAHLVRASEVKKAIEWVMCNLDGHYAADSVAAAIALGAMVAESSQESNGQGSSLPPNASLRSTSKSLSSPGKGSDAPSPSNLSKNFRADVLRENAEAVFAACDAAHGRWAKLLGVRALLHPKLRLQDFLSIYNITQEFITATEKIGGRLGYSIRGTLQSQAKSFVDFQHESRMTKIRAVLDQETWVEVDVPDEFQAIVSMLFDSEAIISGSKDNAEINMTESYSNEGSQVAETGSRGSVEQTEQIDSSGTTAVNASQGKASSQSNSSNTKERGKNATQTLEYGGVSYHMVNCGLILLKMLSEYIDMNHLLPALSLEVVHRVVEILKFFNTRTCQLVLGAGAMQVSGLKSITSKHLALASQVISFTYAIIPELKQILFLKVPEPRKSLLLLEFDRVAQDYKVHRDEIHTKLVQIMRERLLVHLRGLPQIIESWNRPEDADLQPSQFAKSLTKEVGFLQRVLSRTLHEVDVQAIFRQVVVVFHSQISEAFSRLEISTPQAKDRLHRDVTHILGCIRSLPCDNSKNSVTPNWGQLDEFLAQRFGAESG
ncbi:hypothetical protein V6N12_003451 [Hibiscus sabdariffa]|uniref:Vacuolar protein sorting-associated protein 54 C-terminal domain-containing protein n=1 Tax=Hibiscus sabdariffa TaxID=183260 RepID=A0ABR2AQV8_9ROSI